MSKIIIEMVAGGQYGSPLFQNRTLTVGETIEVDEAKAESFLSDGYYDIANNFHHYFKRKDGAPAPQAKEAAPIVDGAVDGDEGEGEGEGEGEAAPAASAAKATKAAKTATPRRRAG